MLAHVPESSDERVGDDGLLEVVRLDLHELDGVVGRFDVRLDGVDLRRLQPTAFLVPLEIIRQRLVVAFHPSKGLQQSAHLRRLADADRINHVL